MALLVFLLLEQGKPKALWPLVLPKQQENENQRVFRPLVFTKQQQENKSQPFGFSFPAAGAGKTKAKDKTIPKLMFYLLKSVQQE
jgi:hypothetical protein